MPIREFDEIKLAVLNYVADKREYSQRIIVDALEDCLSLTDEERNRRVPSGKRVFYNSCVTAIDRLMKRNLLVRTIPGHYRITSSGLEFLRQNSGSSQKPDPIDNEVSPLLEEPDFSDDGTGSIPEEAIEDNYQRIRKHLATALLKQIKEKSPRFFEELVIDLLVEMGYGGSREDAAKAVGRSGDGGIDGIINEDRLGLDVVYVQAKRWEANVSRPELQKFAGALQGQRARKGIFITTSGFSRDAREYVNNIESKIVLIDGHQLAEYMIDHNVGVSVVKSYELKRVDSDYFIETDDSQTQDS